VFAVYLGIPEEKEKDHETVKKVLRSAFSPDSFRANEEYVSHRLNNGESVDVYFADLTQLAAAADDVISQQWLMCAFVVGLPDSIREQIRASCLLSDMTPEQVVEKARLLIATSELRFLSLRPKPVKKVAIYLQSLRSRRPHGSRLQRPSSATN